MNDLGERDLESIDPPAELWARIADAVVGAAAEPSGAPVIVEYRIDGNDVVIEVGGSWAEFAGDNDAPELVDTATGRTLWSSMTPGDLAELWKAAVARVRERGQAASVPFRCDGPGARRWFEMTITPEDDGHLRFRSEMTFEMVRPDVQALRRANASSDDETVDVCSWCGEADDGARWRPVEEVLAARRLLEGSPAVTVHFGICPTCHDKVSNDLLAPGRTGS